MFFARRPSRQAIEDFIATSREQPLSYGPIGLAQSEPAGYRVDETVVAIGRGTADFGRATAALARCHTEHW
jgi:hypothetical protein